MNRNIFSLLVILFTVVHSKTSFSNLEWSEQKKINYIGNSLAALIATPINKILKIQKQMGVENRSSCRSSIINLKLQCLMKQMNIYCGKFAGRRSKQCKYISDTIIVNKLSENDHLSSRERFFLLKKKGSHQEKMSDALMKKYSNIAAKLSLSKFLDCYEVNHECFAHSLNNFCTEYNYRGELGWQSCVSSLLWFIAISQ
ncbi:MAG: hypothetical protein AB8G05_20940 [Oligoflexales bacterium]